MVRGWPPRYFGKVMLVLGYISGLWLGVGAGDSYENDAATELCRQIAKDRSLSPLERTSGSLCLAGSLAVHHGQPGAAAHALARHCGAVDSDSQLCAAWLTRLLPGLERQAQLVNAKGVAEGVAAGADGKAQLARRQACQQVGDGWRALALCRLRLNHFAEASVAMAAAAELAPSNDTFLAETAELWLRAGDQRAAVDMMSAALFTARHQHRLGKRETHARMIRYAHRLVHLTAQGGSIYETSLVTREGRAHQLSLVVSALLTLSGDDEYRVKAIAARRSLHQQRRELLCPGPRCVKVTPAPLRLAQAPPSKCKLPADTDSLDELLFLYSQWHAHILEWGRTHSGPGRGCADANVLVFAPMNGLGNRMHALISAFAVALITGRAFFIDWRDRPSDWSDVLAHPLFAWDWHDAVTGGFVCHNPAKFVTVTLYGTMPGQGQESTSMSTWGGGADPLRTLNCNAAAFTLDSALWPEERVLWFDGYQRIRIGPDDLYASVTHTTPHDDKDIFSDNCNGWKPSHEPSEHERNIVRLLTSGGKASIYQTLSPVVAEPSAHVLQVMAKAKGLILDKSAPPVVGMHVRVGTLHTSGYEILSPGDVDRFISTAAAVAAKVLKATKFRVYVMTDSSEVSRRLKAHYKEQMIYVNGPIAHSGSGSGPLTSHYKAHAESLLLGLCDYVLLSAFSSLGEYAVARSGVQYCVIGDTHCGQTDRHRCPVKRMRPCELVLS